MEESAAGKEEMVIVKVVVVCRASSTGRRSVCTKLPKLDFEV